MAKAGWHPEDIKAELRKRFGPLQALSERLGLHRGAVSLAINSPSSSSKTEAKIAEALGVKPHVIWPERWSVEGHLLPRLARINRIPAPRAAQRQRDAVA